MKNLRIWNSNVSLNNVIEMEDELKSHFVEYVDFELHYAMGDDISNAITIKHPTLLKSEIGLEVLNLSHV